MHELSDSVVYYGGDVKALGAGKVGGYVVRFGSPESADVQGDFFNADTDYGLDIAAKARVVYHHGLTRKLGPARLGVVDLATRPDGIWAEGTLDTARPEVKSIYEDVESGKLGWSSGSVDRLTDRKSVSGKNLITSWPLIEVSLTPKPVDPRNRAVAIKALVDEIKGEHLGRYAGPDAAGAAMDRLHEITSSRVRDHMARTGTTRAERLQNIKGCLDEHAGKAHKLAGALMDDHDGDEAGPSLKSLLGELGLGAGPSLADRSERLVADATEILGLYRKAAAQRHAEGRHLSATKRGAIKALAEELLALAAVPGGKADPGTLRALKARLLAGRL